MAKIDFSALKKADLQSVAPIGEGLRPNAVLGGALKTSPAIPVEVEPVVESAVAAPVGRKISITGLRGGNPASAAPMEAEAWKDLAVEPPVLSVANEWETEAPIVRKSPLIRIGKAHKETESTTAPTEVVEEVSNPEVNTFNEIDPVGHAAEVIGSEAEALAKKLLESDDNVDSASIVFQKESQEAAPVAEELSIPENLTGKEFFPNLPVGDDFLSEFIGIEPPAKGKKETEKIAVATETPVPAVPQSEVSMEPPTEAVAEIANADPVVALEETTETVSQAETSMETSTQEDAVVSSDVSADSAVQTEAVAEYVDAVAKDFSAVRKGGLSSLFSNKKVLVPSVAAFFGTFAVIGYLAVGGFVSKTSVPEVPPPASESTVEPVPQAPSGGSEVSTPPSSETPAPSPTDVNAPPVGAAGGQPVGVVESPTSPIPPDAVMRVSAPGFESYVNPIRKPNRKPPSVPDGK